MNKIITISREFGSGGRELGRRLAQAIGMAYYDREIISAIAARSGLAEKYVESVSERGIYVYYPTTFGRSFSLHSAVPKEQMDILVQQRKILREIAEKSDCVIVGRSADIILEDYKPLNMFIYADKESKLNRCRARQDSDSVMSDSELKKQIARIDRGRAQSRSVITDAKWGDKSAYHICINTTGWKIEQLIPTVMQLQADYFKESYNENSSV